MVVMLIDKDFISKLVHPTFLSWLIKEGGVAVLEYQATCRTVKLMLIIWNLISVKKNCAMNLNMPLQSCHVGKHHYI